MNSSGLPTLKAFSVLRRGVTTDDPCFSALTPTRLALRLCPSFGATAGGSLLPAPGVDRREFGFSGTRPADFPSDDRVGKVSPKPEGSESARRLPESPVREQSRPNEA